MADNWSDAYMIQFILVLVFLSDSLAFSQETQSLQTQQSYDSYFTIDDTSSEWLVEQAASHFIEFEETSFLFTPFFTSASLKQQTGIEISLMNWILHNETPSLPREEYNRKSHFGAWISDRYDDNCYNTRAKVLIRDSVGPIQFKDTNSCIVESGTWRDPYTNKIVNRASEIQIDHMVPLKNAFVSGAWKWAKEKRCLFANYLGNFFHLKPVLAAENLRKGDRYPGAYLPKNTKGICEYISDWLKIKLIWQLEMMPPEAEAIRQNVNNYHCEINTMLYPNSELKIQRNLIVEDLKICTR